MSARGLSEMTARELGELPGRVADLQERTHRVCGRLLDPRVELSSAERDALHSLVVTALVTAVTRDPSGFLADRLEALAAAADGAVSGTRSPQPPSGLEARRTGS